MMQNEGGAQPKPAPPKTEEEFWAAGPGSTSPASVDQQESGIYFILTSLN